MVLKALSGKIDRFYLAGGTALSLFYFQHRLSVDLDFFTPDFRYSDVKRIIAYLEGSLNKKIKLLRQNIKEDSVKIAVFNILFSANDTLKMDFVEDTVKLLKEPKIVNGIRILSLEDIYLRKLYALAGMVRAFDETGRDRFLGGRVEAKDFFDIYCLSIMVMPLSKFVSKYCSNTVIVEGIIKWFRTYDRMAIIDGILSLNMNKGVDYRTMEKYFKTEVNKIIDTQIGEI